MNKFEMNVSPISQPETAALHHASPFEPFVDEHVVGRFLQISPRRILEMARKGELPSHSIGRVRRTWRFRLSEIDAHFGTPAQKRSGAKIGAAVPGTQERKKLG
jgi:hypothetical protein